MFRRVFIAAAALIASMPAGAQNSDLSRLAPSSPWGLNYAEEHCELARSFGEGDRAVTLALRSYEPEGRFYILLSGPLARPASSAERIEVSFAQIETWQPTYVAGEIAGQPTIMLKPVFSFGPLSKDADRRMKENRPVLSYSEPGIEAEIETIQFTDGLEREFVLATGSMGEPMAALRECARGIADGWGVTFAERQSLSRVATPRSSMRWIGSSGFQRRLAAGSFWSLLLIIDEEGSVADCRVRGAASTADAEEACDVARNRARFNPALDAEGNPASDYWLLTVQP